MTELVQLERRHADFEARDVRVIAVSIEGMDDARKTQEEYPHLTILSDEDLSLAGAAGVVHPGASPDGADTDVPTTILVDRDGTVRWIYRSPSVIERLSPDDLLTAIGRRLP